MDGQLVRPGRAAVRAVLIGVMLASLLMAAALPGAFGPRACCSRRLRRAQVGRNAAAASCCPPGIRCATCSSASSCGASRRRAVARRRDPRGDPAAAVDRRARRSSSRRPRRGYWPPGRGRAATTDYDIEGGALRRALPAVHHHRARRVDRRDRRDRRRCGRGPSTVVLCLVIAFVETRGAVVAVLRRGRRDMRARDAPLRRSRPPRARRLHVPAPADRRGHHRDGGRRRSAHRRSARAPHGMELAMVLGGPALYVLGENLFRGGITGTASRAASRSSVRSAPARAARRPPQRSAARAIVAASLSDLAIWPTGCASRRRGPHWGCPGATTGVQVPGLPRTPPRRAAEQSRPCLKPARYPAPGEAARQRRRPAAAMPET